MLREFRAPSSCLRPCSLSAKSGPAGLLAPRTACHPGTRGFTAFLCGVVKLHHSPRVLHLRPLSVALALLQTALVPGRADGTTVAACRRECKRLAPDMASDPPALRLAVLELEGRDCAKPNEKGPPTLRRQQVILTPEPGPTHLVRYCGSPQEAWYRSLDGYLSSQARIRHCSGRGNIDFWRVKRAVARRRGPPQSDLPFLYFTEFGDSVAPLVPARPCHPQRSLIISSWCTLREIEAANATPRCVSCSGARNSHHPEYLPSNS